MSTVPLLHGRRLKRFSRPQTPTRGIRITQRDIDILRYIHAYRFLSTEHLAMLDGGSRQNMQRCLESLWQHQLLDRPRAQLTRIIADGNQPLVYALARKGAKLLAGLDGSDIDSLNWTLKNNRASTLFITHSLGIADVMVPMMVGCKAPGAPRLIDQPELLTLMPEATAKSRNPFLWRATVAIGHRKEPIALVPDRLFSVMSSDGTRRNFALELDTGSMPVRSLSLKRSSIRKKLIGYLEGWRAKEHETWGFDRLRVLFVTNSHARINTMRDCLMEVTHGRGSGMFLFACHDDVVTQHPFSTIWVTDKGEKVGLL